MPTRTFPNFRKNLSKISLFTKLKYQERSMKMILSITKEMMMNLMQLLRIKSVNQSAVVIVEVVVAEVAAEVMKENMLHPTKMKKARRVKKEDSRKDPPRQETDHTKNSRNTKNTKRALLKTLLIKKKQRKPQ